MHHPTMSKYYFEHDFTEFEEFITSYPAHHKYYEKGDIISAQSETLKYGYYIKQGIMKLSIGHECGKEKIAALFGPGSFFLLESISIIMIWNMLWWNRLTRKWRLMNLTTASFGPCSWNIRIWLSG